MALITLKSGKQVEVNLNPGSITVCDIDDHAEISHIFRSSVEMDKIRAEAQSNRVDVNSIVSDAMDRIRENSAMIDVTPEK